MPLTSLACRRAAKAARMVWAWAWRWAWRASAPPRSRSRRRTGRDASATRAETAATACGESGVHLAEMVARGICRVRDVRRRYWAPSRSRRSSPPPWSAPASGGPEPEPLALRVVEGCSGPRFPSCRPTCGEAALFWALKTDTSASDERPCFGFLGWPDGAFSAPAASGAASGAAHHGLSSTDRRSLALRRTLVFSERCPPVSGCSGRAGFCAGLAFAESACALLREIFNEAFSWSPPAGWRPLLFRRLAPSAAICSSGSVRCWGASAEDLTRLARPPPSPSSCAFSVSPAPSPLVLLRGRVWVESSSFSTAVAAFCDRPVFLGAVSAGSLA